MDFMLEEELLNLMTFCLQNPESDEISEKHKKLQRLARNSMMMEELMH